jgi:hypothetical protein
MEKKYAFRFLILLAIVRLFADMTYEVARSTTGPYLAVLGASTTTVGIVGGLGQLSGCGLRIMSGSLALNQALSQEESLSHKLDVTL